MSKENKSYPHGKKSLGFVNLLKSYYHLESKDLLFRSFLSDLITSFLMSSGSGLLSSLFRGVYFKLFLNYKNLALIGRLFKVINRYNVKIGSNFWAKDGVTLFAGGPLIIGNACVLCDRSSIWSGKKGVFIGDRCSLGIGSYVCGTMGKIKIGDDVIMADHVRLYSWNHQFTRNKAVFSKQPVSQKGIIIGNNCWLGSGVMIADGVTLGRNCVVGAGAVVTNNFGDNLLVAGVPAKIIKKIK